MSSQFKMRAVDYIKWLEDGNKALEEELGNLEKQFGDREISAW
jgi:hypothetical protein